MTITKICLIIMIFLLTTKRCLAKSANSQQPTANSQQPTANSQQINFNQNNILFSDSAFLLRAVSEFILAIRSMFCSKTFRSFALRIHRWLLFFYAYCEVIEVYKRQKKSKENKNAEVCTS